MIHHSNPKLLLTSLLPFDVACYSKFFRQQLQGYSFLIKSLLKAIEYLEEKEMHHFDALVGENACQIRALKLCQITSSCIDSFSLKLPNLLSLKHKINGLLDNPITPYTGILQDFLIQHDLNVELSKDEVFIFDCFLLTMSKKSFPPTADSPLLLIEKSDSSAFKRFDPIISGQFAKEHFNKTRQRLAFSSVEFIRDEAQEISGLEIASKMVSPAFTILHNRLECISCFWSIFIIMKRSTQLKIPIILLAYQKATDLEYKILNTVAILFRSDGEQYYIPE
jgi:hypothetical protein